MQDPSTTALRRPHLQDEGVALGVEGVGLGGQRGRAGRLGAGQAAVQVLHQDLLRLGDRVKGLRWRSICCPSFPASHSC